MAIIPNTRKKFHFIVEIDGVNQAEIQKVTLPVVEIAATAHGEGNTTIKTPGLVTTGDMVFEKIRSATQSDTWAWDWLTEAQDPFAGGGDPTDFFKRNLVIKEMDPAGNRTVNRWLCEGVWVRIVNGGELDRASSDNVVEVITLSVDKCRRV